MRISTHLFVSIILTSMITVTVYAQKRVSPRILSAKFVCFDDQLGVAAVGDKAFAQLKRWGRFQIVQNRKEADIVIVLSADTYKGGQIILSGGQTGTMGKDGSVDVDRVPNYNQLAPVRYAYLTVVDSKTGEKLWSDSHQWGGLLTGFNSVGERLVKELEKQIKKQ
jgi:hypothetical protein